MTRLFVFGLGYCARAVVARMRPRLSSISGTTREAEKQAGIAAQGVMPIRFDGTAPQPAVSEALSNIEHVLVALPPDETGDPVLRHHGADLAASKPRSIVYLSTVGVYGDHCGAWVDEESLCKPVSERSRLRLETEAGWQRFAAETSVPVAIIRLGGIYGPGRGPFAKIRRGTAQRIVRPGQVFNRIHVDDIAAIVVAAFDERADGIFNGVDDEPAPPEDVLTFAAGLLGVPPPPEVSFEQANLTPMARSFYGESKRARNDKIKRELGVRLAYPTYREGLQAVHEDEHKRGSSVLL